MDFLGFLNWIIPKVSDTKITVWISIIVNTALVIITLCSLILAYKSFNATLEQSKLTNENTSKAIDYTHTAMVFGFQKDIEEKLNKLIEENKDTNPFNTTKLKFIIESIILWHPLLNFKPT